MKVRPAQESDLHALQALTRELGYPAQIDALRERLSAMRGLGDHAVLVAEHRGHVIGWIHVFRAVRLESGDFAEIGGMIVSQHQRRAGAGRALLQAAQRWAAARGLRRVRVRSQPHRGDAHAFYRAAGFQELKRQTVFEREL